MEKRLRELHFDLYFKIKKFFDYSNTGDYIYFGKDWLLFIHVAFSLTSQNIGGIDFDREEKILNDSSYIAVRIKNNGRDFSL